MEKFLFLVNLVGPKLLTTPVTLRLSEKTIDFIEKKLRAVEEMQKKWDRQSLQKD